MRRIDKNKEKDTVSLPSFLKQKMD